MDIMKNELYYCDGFGAVVPILQQFRSPTAPDCRTLQIQERAYYAAGGKPRPFSRDKDGYTVVYYCAAQDINERYSSCNSQCLWQLEMQHRAQQQAESEAGWDTIFRIMGTAAGVAATARGHTIPQVMPRAIVQQNPAVQTLGANTGCTGYGSSNLACYQAGRLTRAQYEANVRAGMP